MRTDIIIKIKVVKNITGIKGYLLPLPHCCQRRLVNLSTILIKTIKIKIKIGGNNEQAAILAEISPQAI